MRLRPRTWGKLTVGVLVIGGVLAGLWAAFQPAISPTVAVKPPPKPPALHDTRAVVVLQLAKSARSDRATIACNGRRQAATGFWQRSAHEACDALASTRRALLSGPRCSRTSQDRTRLHVKGAFGARSFDVLQQDGGCPEPDGWLGVNALASPVLVPSRKAADAPGG